MFSLLSLQSYVSYRLSIVSLSCILASKLPILCPIFFVLCSLFSVHYHSFSSVVCTLSCVLSSQCSVLYPSLFFILCLSSFCVNCSSWFVVFCFCLQFSVLCPLFFVLRSLSFVFLCPLSPTLHHQSYFFFFCTVLCCLCFVLLCPQSSISCLLSAILAILCPVSSILYHLFLSLVVALCNLYWIFLLDNGESYMFARRLIIPKICRFSVFWCLSSVSLPI